MFKTRSTSINVIKTQSRYCKQNYALDIDIETALLEFPEQQNVVIES